MDTHLKILRLPTTITCVKMQRNFEELIITETCPFDLNPNIIKEFVIFFTSIRQPRFA